MSFRMRHVAKIRRDDEEEWSRWGWSCRFLISPQTERVC